MEVQHWMESVSGADWLWYVKFLSGNDTLLTEAHQAGPYLPKRLILDLFPSVDLPTAENPRVNLPTRVESHGVEADLKVIWYNNRYRGGTRNECRITNWGGKDSPILDPESTGSLCVFAFHKVSGRDADICRVWLCSTIEEEDAVQDRTGPVEPGAGLAYTAGGQALPVELRTVADSPCRLQPNEIPAEWKSTFPEASAVVDFSLTRVPTTRAQSPDQRIIRRRECEFEVFRSVEEVVVLPRIRAGFSSVEVFVDFANAVTNRRKSRSGASLEYHARHVFEEEQLAHSHDEISEDRKRPDFLFPSAHAYRDSSFPAEKLQMLGVKTTCKDRWRQIINEADRIPDKYLLTLQEGISPSQFAEMRVARVSLVVPQPLHRTYHDYVRQYLLTVEEFIKRTKAKCA